MRSISYCALILVPLAALGLLFFHGLMALHQPVDLNPTFHVASRYVDRAAQETGDAGPFWAVLLDYRGFYLVLLGLLNLAVILIAFLFSVTESFPFRSWEKFFYGAAWSFSFGLLVWGSCSLWNGSNWMDYEFLAGPLARIQGAWVSGSLSFASTFFSLILARSVWVRGKEQFFDRK